MSKSESTPATKAELAALASPARLTASKITAGTITGSKISISGAGGMISAGGGAVAAPPIARPPLAQKPAGDFETILELRILRHDGSEALRLVASFWRQGQVLAQMSTHGVYSPKSYYFPAEVFWADKFDAQYASLFCNALIDMQIIPDSTWLLREERASVFRAAQVVATRRARTHAVTLSFTPGLGYS